MALCDQEGEILGMARFFAGDLLKSMFCSSWAAKSGTLFSICLPLSQKSAQQWPVLMESKSSWNLIEIPNSCFLAIWKHCRLI